MMMGFVLVGVTAFGAYGLANTLTVSGTNEIQTIEIVDAHQKSLRQVDLGTSSTITQVPLLFTGDDTFWNGRTVTVDIHDINGVLIGTGSVVASNNSTTVTLSDPITAIERPDLRKVTITST